MNTTNDVIASTGRTCPPCSGECRQGRACPATPEQAMEWLQKRSNQVHQMADAIEVCAVVLLATLVVCAVVLLATLGVVWAWHAL